MKMMMGFGGFETTQVTATAASAGRVVASVSRSLCHWVPGCLLRGARPLTGTCVLCAALVLCLPVPLVARWPPAEQEGRGQSEHRGQGYGGHEQQARVPSVHEPPRRLQQAARLTLTSQRSPVVSTVGLRRRRAGGAWGVGVVRVPRGVRTGPGSAHSRSASRVYHAQKDTRTDYTQPTVAARDG
jgi:hypothetical protein